MARVIRTELGAENKLNELGNSVKCEYSHRNIGEHFLKTYQYAAESSHKTPQKIVTRQTQ